MADPICRWRNSSIKQLMEFNSLLPLNVTSKDEGREHVEALWRILGGEDFFTTPYQLAAQMGTYYEDNEYLYPKFDKYLSIEEAAKYMHTWGENYYSPNPYTKSIKNARPVVINKFLVNYAQAGLNLTLTDALHEMFGDNIIGNTDILKNMLNTFSEVNINKEDIVSVKPVAQGKFYKDEEIYPPVDADDKKAFFEHFGKVQCLKPVSIKNNLPLQQIFYGAPGTGKSHTINKDTNESNRIRTTFHPDYDYATFVGCYKPSSERKNMLDGHGYSITQLLDRFFESKDESKYKGSIKARYLYESLVNYEDIRRHGLNASDIASRLTAMGFDKTAYTTEASCMYNIYEWLKSDGYIMDSKITYKFVPQSFTKAYIEAWRRFANPECTDKNFYLVIEEINRGNCAQIFGDLFQLLDRTRGGYSSYAVEADTDFQQFLATDEEWKLNITLTEDILNDEGCVIAKAEDVASGKVLVLPPNLYIWATMNTSDQSLFPIDSAFKRRWDWKYVPISNKDENYKIEVKKEDGLYRYDWWEFLDRVNTAIANATSSEDKKLGYFFCKADEKGVITADRFVSKVIFYIWNDVFKDYEISEAKFHYGEDDLSLLSTKIGDEEVKREFSSFFNEQGYANHENVANLLDDLKIECELVIEGKEEENSGSDESAAGGFLKVIFPGENPITGSCTDVYFKTIQRLDVSEVRKLNLINEANGYLLIGTNEELPPNMLASRKDEATGLKVQTLKGHEARVSMLEKIRELLEADFEIITSSNDTPSERVSDTNMPYRVTFPDGEVICEGSGWETYVTSLRKIGLDKALPYGEIFHRKNKTMPLITTKRIPDDGIYKYYDVDGYFVLSGTDSQHRLLRRMNKDLNLGLTIE